MIISLLFCNESDHERGHRELGQAKLNRPNSRTVLVVFSLYVATELCDIDGPYKRKVSQPNSKC